MNTDVDMDWDTDTDMYEWKQIFERIETFFEISFCFEAKLLKQI
jgi:hypothetical protein